MKKLLPLLLVLSVFLCSCGQVTPPDTTAQPKPEITVPAPPTAEEIAAQTVAELLSSMTNEEKVGQLFFGRCPAKTAIADIDDYHLGGYLLFGRDFKDKTANEIIQNIAAYQEASKIPMLIGVDEEGGSVVRLSSNPNIRSEKFRSPQELFAGGGMDTIVHNTHKKDILLRAFGINVNLAPVADVSTSSSDFMYPRTFGQNAEATADYVSNVVSTMRNDSMGSVLKHFPGYGNNPDTHTGIAVDKRSLESFETTDFLPFSAGMKAGDKTVAVLVSHTIMTSVDENLPASLSPAVHDIVRSSLNFDGVIMTDDLAMDAVQAYTENGTAAVQAVLAGNDLIITTDYAAEFGKILAAAEDGTISQDLLDGAVSRVLLWKYNLGLLE